MQRIVRLGVAAVLAAVLVTSPASAGDDFVCPEIGQIDSADLLAKIEPLLPSDIDLEAPQQLESVIFAFHAEGIPPATAVNNLVAAYSPAVAPDRALSDAEKTRRVQQFARTATELVYSQEP
jgi:hypothetical protein